MRHSGVSMRTGKSAVIHEIMLSVNGMHMEQLGSF
jgi:hypothetical protein